MDLAFFIKSRLEELGLEQKDLAASAQVTDSYISQLLARKKLPPSAARTEIYARMSSFLKLPEGELSKLADLQRHERLKKLLREQASPLHPQCRETLLSKCAGGRQKEVRLIFERESFGELERLITQSFLGLARNLAKDHRGNEDQVLVIAEKSGRHSEEFWEEIRAYVDSEPFNISDEICASLLSALIEGWDVDLRTFRVDLVPNRKVMPSGRKQFQFMETVSEQPAPLEPGFREFLADSSLSGGATQEELAFLKILRVEGRRPTRIFYYRQLQNLRDPLNFGDLLNLSSPNKRKG